MAKKKDEAAQQPPAAVPQQGMPQPMMPGMMPGMGMPMPGQMPGMMPGGNPMMAMWQMMQMMAGGGAPMGVDPAALPFAAGAALATDEDRGLDADIIRPATFKDLIRTQQAVPTGSVLDVLCLTEDVKHALGGLPKGCTMAFVGPPGKGKTRTALVALSRVAAAGERVAYIVAEEGFHDAEGSGRNDLCSRLVQIGMAATGLDEEGFREKVLENLYVLESQYHKGQTWDDFVAKYRYLVEKEEIDFVVIDSLNMLDPTRHNTADNLSALKTYNHEKGITCLCIGQIKDTGAPVGGEALMHTADAVFLIEEMGLGSKEMAALWGGKYRDRIDIIRAIKCVTAPTVPHPIRVGQSEQGGTLVVHPDHPGDEYPVPEPAR